MLREQADCPAAFCLAWTSSSRARSYAGIANGDLWIIASGCNDTQKPAEKLSRQVQSLVRHAIGVTPRDTITLGRDKSEKKEKKNFTSRSISDISNMTLD